MNQRAAFDETVALAIREGMPEMTALGDSLGLAHLRGMQHRIAKGDFSEAKLGRWLGWAQAALVAANIGVTLEDVKQINLSHAGEEAEEPKWLSTNEVWVVDGWFHYWESLHREFTNFNSLNPEKDAREWYEFYKTNPSFDHLKLYRYYTKRTDSELIDNYSIPRGENADVTENSEPETELDQ